MELATYPQNSSAMSTESPMVQVQLATGTGDEHQQAAGSSSGTEGRRTRPRKARKPKKVASDSRVDAHGAGGQAVQQGGAEPPQRGQRRRVQSDETSEEQLEEQALKYGASHVIHLFVPVSLCMAVVILTMLTVGYYSVKGDYLPYTPFHEEYAENNTDLVLRTLANALILLLVIIVMTTILIVLYKFRCYKIIHGWLMLSSLMLLSVFTISYIEELFKNYNIPLDYLTLAFFVWNWCFVGMLVIHWQGPLLLQQFYLVTISALMALMFIKHLPEWSVWSILAVLSIWDLVAVLCPKGPLRILVETAQQRNEPIFPALIYSSGVLYLYTLYGILTTEPAENEAETGEADDQPAAEQLQPTTTTSSSVVTVVVQHHQQQQRDGSASSTDGLLGGVGAAAGTSGTGSKREGRPGQRTAPNRGRGTTTTSGDTLITTIGTTTSTSSRQATPGSVRSRSPPQRRVVSEQNLAAREREELAMVEQERGIKLGLGDFIFYSVLVGKASSYGDWNITIACYVSILVGLAFTLMLLALFRKALPALPISIFAGILFFFATKLVITPFTRQLALRQLVL